MKSEENDIIHEIATIVCVTKAISWTEAWNMSQPERKILAKVVKEIADKKAKQ